MKVYSCNGWGYGLTALKIMTQDAWTNIGSIEASPEIAQMPNASDSTEMEFHFEIGNKTFSKFFPVKE